MVVAAPARMVSHYRLEEQLGSGGMGVVWRAVDERLGRRVAIKFLTEAAAANPDLRARFVEEARAASSLDHPNICAIHEIDTTPEGETFLVMAFYEGEALDSIIRRGPLPLPRALTLAIQTSRGLAAAHEELIVHRDIKPANLLVTTRETVKILDFGLARLASDEDREHGFVIGTPAYMAPEQLCGESVDCRADIWSLGVVLWEMLTGVRLFDRERVDLTIDAVLHGPIARVSQHRAEVPQKLQAAVEKALARNRANRFESVDEFAALLTDIKGDIDSTALTTRRPAASHRHSLAVLPFSDMSASRDQEYLCEGIAEEIVASLRRVPDLFVASRTSTFRFKGRSEDVREIGRALNVEHVLEGSIRRAGDRVRIAAQLVSTDSGFCLWYERFDREITDIFAIEDEIAEQIARRLQLTLSTLGRSAAASLTKSETEAYELVLQGRQFFHQHRRKALEIALLTFARAIELDPSSARAYAGAAICNAFLRIYFGQGPERIAAADEASLRALELDPELAEVMTARGLALSLKGDEDGARLELLRAVEHDPLFYDAHYFLGRLCFGRGEFLEASSHFRDACGLVREAYDSWYLLGMCFRKLGDTARARSADLECIEAVNRRVRQHPDDTRAWTMGAAVLAELGESDRAAAWVERALVVDRDEPIIMYNAACVYVALGRFDDALSCLARFGGSIPRSWVENDPDLDPLRGDERFAQLLEG